MKVGDLVRHKEDDFSIYSGKVGIILKTNGVQYPQSERCLYPDILWQDGIIGTAHVKYLESPLPAQSRLFTSS